MDDLTLQDLRTCLAALYELPAKFAVPVIAKLERLIAERQAQQVAVSEVEPKKSNAVKGTTP